MTVACGNSRSKPLMGWHMTGTTTRDLASMWEVSDKAPSTTMVPSPNLDDLITVACIACPNDHPTLRAHR